EKKIIYLLSALAVIIIDQFSKKVVVDNYPYIINDGIALGIFRGSNLIAVFLAIIVLSALGYFLIRIPEFKTKLILSLVSAAAFSNLIDRISKGGVVDFINIFIFPSFNFADFIISFGIIVLVYLIFKKEWKKEISK
ncbi:MAG TPA: signal peptidase II, partial [Candidatus Dojkabacteria bacterium]